MTVTHRPEATIFAIFGAGGDLASRKLIPALYSLFREKWLPEKFAILGLGHLHGREEDFLLHLRQEAGKFSRHRVEEGSWQTFISHFAFLTSELDDPQTFSALAQKIAGQEKAWGAKANRIFYLALPPQLIEPAAQQLARAKLNQDRGRARIVVEKPFGRNLDSARALNQSLTQMFYESQIFRIDHYLGKETVQNILAFRFANTLFEPVWNRHYIDHIQITVAEKLGVELRGHYYDQAGALRDMIQNHLLQILCLVAMEAPISFEADEVRNKKVDVLHAIRPILPEQVNQYAVRGQYGSGWVEGDLVPGYHSEPDVSPDSATETYAAVKLFVDNWRWQDVPFYLRTGKRLPSRISEVSIQFRPVPHQTFPPSALLDWRPNRLLIAIQPEEGILIRFEAKHPGPTLRLSPVIMQFYYREAFKTEPPEAYETLLLDVMRGDTTLFMRGDQVEAAWEVLSPILDTWESIKPADFPNYQAGTWGPEGADILIAQDGRSWIMPTFLQCQEDTAICRVTLMAPS
ncbi:MAG: glucose-6-phosphate dehydrogenase [Thermodesulfobacteriota bacterium]